MELTQVGAAKHGLWLRVIDDVTQGGCEPLQTQAFRPRSDLSYPFHAERIKRGESGFGQGEQTVIHFIEEAADGRTGDGC